MRGSLHSGGKQRASGRDDVCLAVRQTGPPSVEMTCVCGGIKSRFLRYVTEWKCQKVADWALCFPAHRKSAMDGAPERFGRSDATRRFPSGMTNKRGGFLNLR